MAKKLLTPVSALPVMKSHCKTCPFKCNKNGIRQDVKLANEVIQRTLFKGQQICHSTDVNRCKGAYDHNFEIYDRMGFSHILV